MTNREEYQQLMQKWIEGGKMEGGEKEELQRLLARDPDVARLHDQLLRVEQSVEQNRTTLLNMEKREALRDSVSALSRSVPGGASTGLSFLTKFIGGISLLLLVVVGLWVMVGEKNPVENASSGIPQTEIRPEVLPSSSQHTLENRGGVNDEMKAEKGETVSVSRREMEKVGRNASTPVEEPPVTTTEGRAETYPLSTDERQGEAEQKETKRRETNDVKGNGMFDTSSLSTPK